MKSCYSIKILLLMVILTTLTSCFKDEPLNQECDIQSASVHLADPSLYFYNATDTAVAITKDYASQNIVFENVLLNADLSAMAPVFTLTPGATIQPASGTTRDFSGGAQQYVVTSEDGNFTRTYNVRFAKPQHYYQYDFEKYYLNEYNQYYIWSDLPDGEAPNWSTANAGYSIACGSAAPEEYPSVPDANGYEGACVRLTTSSTGVWGELTNKPLAAGNLFLGSFDISKALTNTLQSSRFGIPTEKKPLRFTGYYKYQPGTQMQNRYRENIEGTDSAAIYAVVYKNHDAEGNSVILTGEDIMSSPARVGMAKLYDIKTTTEWTSFDIEFTYWAETDPQVLASLGYSLAVVCSSSKNGDKYEGALGSTLWVDKLAIITDE